MPNTLNIHLATNLTAKTRDKHWFHGAHEYSTSVSLLTNINIKEYFVIYSPGQGKRYHDATGCCWLAKIKQARRWSWWPSWQHCSGLLNYYTTTRPNDFFSLKKFFCDFFFCPFTYITFSKHLLFTKDFLLWSFPSSLHLLDSNKWRFLIHVETCWTGRQWVLLHHQHTGNFHVLHIRVFSPTSDLSCRGKKLV